MKYAQAKNAGFLFMGQTVIKFAHLAKQILLAFFLGVSADIDLFLAAQIIPAILSSMVGGGAGEVLITSIRQKDEDNSRLVVLFTFCIALITLIAGAIYLLTVPVWLRVFDISVNTSSLFRTLSLLIIINKLPTALVATFKNLLYYKNLYRYYVFTSLASEIAGIIVIVLMVKNYGIIAFAIGMLFTSSLNAILFFNIHGLSAKYLFYAKHWQKEWETLRDLLKKVFSLSMQTLVNHLSTFWERTLSLRFLAPGYLSALNYSKSLTEMPRMVMLTSILTTTYVEQVKMKEKGQNHFIAYSKKMEGLLNLLSAAFQIISVILAPLILIVLLRRGKFDNSAVESTLIIYQILILGFVPGLMMNFLSRTMYVVGKFRQLFYFILAKFIVELTLMVFLVKTIPHAIPIALTAGKFFLSIALFSFLELKFPGIFNKKRFWIIYISLFIFSVFILFVNRQLLPIIIDKTTFEIILWYIPVLIILGLLFLYYIHYLGYLQLVIQKIKSRFHG